MFVLLINLMKFCIWTKRNMCRFEFHKVTSLTIKCVFMNLISLRIKADFIRFIPDAKGPYPARACVGVIMNFYD